MYKKLSLILALILIAIIIVACGTPQAEADTDEPFASKYVHIEIDKETGCEYIVYSNNVTGAGGITPRLGVNGQPLCGKLKQ